MKRIVRAPVFVGVICVSLYRVVRANISVKFVDICIHELVHKGRTMRQVPETLDARGVVVNFDSEERFPR